MASYLASRSTDELDEMGNNGYKYALNNFERKNLSLKYINLIKNKIKQVIIKNLKDNTIPLSAPNINGNEWKYVKDCLDTGWISSAGSYVSKFEDVIKNYTGSKFAVACINGTAGLISLRLIGVKERNSISTKFNICRYNKCHFLYWS